MKKIISLLLAVALVIGVLPVTALADDGTTWDGTTVATAFAGGTGTATDPYRIETAGQLIITRYDNAQNFTILDRVYNVSEYGISGPSDWFNVKLKYDVAEEANIEDTDNNTLLIIIIAGAVVLLAAAGVVTFIVIKKKKA